MKNNLLLAKMASIHTVASDVKSDVKKNQSQACLHQ